MPIEKTKKRAKGEGRWRCFHLTREEDTAARTRKALGLRGLADAVNVVKREVQDGDLDEARKCGSDHLAHEHRPRRDLHVVAELEVPDET